MDSLAGTEAQQRNTRCRHRDPPTRTRRTRFVCVSDTHNTTVKLPKGDVLVHAGDLTNQGSYSEVRAGADSATGLSLLFLPFQCANSPPPGTVSKIVIAGNHDLTLDGPFYALHGPHFHNQAPQSPSDCLSLLTSSPSITYLNHASARITLTSPSGPRTSFSVFGSPYSPRNGLWAFSYDAPPQTQLWDDIPLDADVVVTHTPPRTHRDESRLRRAAGCEALRRALWRVRPRLAVCGHVHEARGAERVAWDLGCANTAFKEDGVAGWEDPGVGQKQSLVDLTAKGGRALENDGATGPRVEDVSMKTEVVGLDVRGLGGDPASARADGEALMGRLGRRETFVVNCAIMAKSWPHVGGKTVNKPIVVDLDLPVWEEE
ncbi:ser thr protein phosphatase family protein [Colletotrichum kahawae]|uniref:Ser thr protein phosphatase family protein n=1 Tax=Colletotrichum kahawae TaxID=34407 RepID=A0AAD9XX38_COLKA|nr:ser thr protein phosphatase family protein [Colletotrichum kahawae]